jgi:hypothetical protein
MFAHYISSLSRVDLYEKKIVTKKKPAFNPDFAVSYSTALIIASEENTGFMNDTSYILLVPVT